MAASRRSRGTVEAEHRADVDDAAIPLAPHVGHDGARPPHQSLALVLAQAVNNPKLSYDILRATRNSLAIDCSSWSDNLNAVEVKY